MSAEDFADSPSSATVAATRPASGSSTASAPPTPTNGRSSRSSGERSKGRSIADKAGAAPTPTPNKQDTDRAVRNAGKAAVNRYKMASGQERDDNRFPGSPSEDRSGDAANSSAPTDDETGDDPTKPEPGSEFDVEEPGANAEGDETETKDAKDEKDEPAEDAIEPSLLERAKKLGLTEESIKDFRHDLAGILGRIESRNAAAAAAKAAESVTGQKPDAPAAPSSALPAPSSSNEDLYKKLEADGIDTAVTGALRSRDKAVADQFASINKELNELRTERLGHELDSIFQSAPENIRALLGKGASDELAQDSPALLIRRELVHEMLRVQAGHRAYGEKVPPLREIFPRAVQTVLGETIHKQREQALLDKVKPRTARIQAPSGARTNSRPEGTPDDRSRRAINSILREADAA